MTTDQARRMITTAGAMLLGALITIILLWRADLDPPTTTPALTQPGALDSQLAIMCVSADPDGQWDRCAWRTGPDTWRVADYPDVGTPRWSCRTTAGDPCRHQPALPPT